MRHGDARLANKAARASARVAAARAARLVGGDGVSGDGHALKNTREFESDDGSVVSVSYGSSPDSLGVRSGDSSDDDAPRVRLARKSEPGLNAFESFRNELAAIDVEASLARGGPASKQSASAPTSPRGGGLRRERLEARDARSGPPRGLTLTQSASPQEELRWAQGPYTAQIGSARLGKTRADSVRGAAGSVRSVRSASARSERNHTSRTRATLPTGTYRDPARTFLRSGQGGAGMARAQRRRAGGARGPGARRAPATAAGDGGGPGVGGARRAGQGGARVGLAQARLRARAVEAADAEARARGAAQGAPRRRGAAVQEPPVRRFERRRDGARGDRRGRRRRLRAQSRNTTEERHKTATRLRDGATRFRWKRARSRPASGVQRVSVRAVGGRRQRTRRARPGVAVLAHPARVPGGGGRRGAPRRGGGGGVRRGAQARHRGEPARRRRGD